MNRNILEGKWMQLKGKVKQQWGDLTDDELDQVSGKFDELAGLIQEKYGYSADEAESRLDDFLNNWGDGLLPGDIPAKGHLPGNTTTPSPRPKPKPSRDEL